MKTNEFGDLVSLVGGLDFDTSIEFYGCFLEEEIGKLIRDYDRPPRRRGQVRGIVDTQHHRPHRQRVR